jgi:hypothetical protein
MWLTGDWLDCQLDNLYLLAERWRSASQPMTYVVGGRRIRVLERTALQAARVLITTN